MPLILLKRYYRILNIVLTIDGYRVACLPAFLHSFILKPTNLKCLKYHHFNLYASYPTRKEIQDSEYCINNWHLWVCLPALCPKLLNGFDLKFWTFFRNSVKYLTSNFNPVRFSVKFMVKFWPYFRFDSISFKSFGHRTRIMCGKMQLTVFLAA